MTSQHCGHLIDNCSVATQSLCVSRLQAAIALLLHPTANADPEIRCSSRVQNGYFCPSPFHLTAKKLRFNHQSLHKVTLIIIIFIIIIIIITILINEMVNVITLNPHPQKRESNVKFLPATFR
jgi:hypothetical protein